MIGVYILHPSSMQYSLGLEASQEKRIQSADMEKIKLEEKLKLLREELNKLETDEMEKILVKRLRNDMGDDYRENEGAKLVMEDHNFLYLRIFNLKKEIIDVKRKLIMLRSKI